MASVSFKTINKPNSIKYLDVEEKHSSSFKTTGRPKVVLYNQTLPFKVKFSSIGVPGRDSLTPPIGIAIIGVNNYIL